MRSDTFGREAPLFTLCRDLEFCHHQELSWGLAQSRPSHPALPGGCGCSGQQAGQRPIHGKGFFRHRESCRSRRKEPGLCLNPARGVPGAAGGRREAEARPAEGCASPQRLKQLWMEMPGCRTERGYLPAGNLSSGGTSPAVEATGEAGLGAPQARDRKLSVCDHDN